MKILDINYKWILYLLFIAEIITVWCLESIIFTSILLIHHHFCSDWLLMNCVLGWVESMRVHTIWIREEFSLCWWFLDIFPASATPPARDQLQVLFSAEAILAQRLMGWPTQLKLLGDRLDSGNSRPLPVVPTQWDIHDIGSISLERGASSHGCGLIHVLQLGWTIWWWSDCFLHIFIVLI